MRAELIAQIKRIAGFLLFDLVWFAAVIGRESWIWITLLLVLGQLALTWSSGRWQPRLIVQLALGGLLLEAILASMGLIDFSGDALLPLWLVLLWIGFAGMALTALDWLQHKVGVAALIGFFGGPISYVIGAEVNAATAPAGLWLMCLGYAIAYAIYMAWFAVMVKRQLSAAN